MSNLTRTITIDLAERKGELQKTYPCVVSTEAPVQRRNFEHGEFDEVLSHKAGAIDLSRAPLPLLESHDSRSLPIGVVESLRVTQDKKLRGEVRFGKSARAKEIEGDVAAGVIRNLSVGYSISESTEKRNGDRKTITATKWTPHEASAVSIGADSGAGFNRSRSQTMQPETKPSPSDTEVQTRAAELERERCSGIISTARALGLEGDGAESLIRDGVSLDDARAQLIDRRAAQDTRIQPAGRVPRGRITAGDDNGDDFRAAAVDSILLRAGVRVAEPHPAARDISPRMADIAGACVSRAGGTVAGGDDQLIKRALATSDFPIILGNVAHVAILKGYEDEPQSHRDWVHVQPVPDFLDQNRPILSSAPALDVVNEGGEYTNGSLTEEATSYSVSKVGKIVSLTWEALVSDRLGSFVRIQPGLGQAARRKEADTVYGMFNENAGSGPTMADGDTLFHANHNNLTAGASLTSTLLGAGRSLLRKQMALGGGYLSLVPKFLIVPSEQETQAELLLASATRQISATQEAITPQWMARLHLVVEPRLDGTAVYLAAAGSQIDTAELGVLEENMGGPTLTQKDGFRTDVLEWKVRHVFGAKFLDWRGMVKMPIS